MEKSMLNNDEENDTISVRKIRVIVSDPFATESSSDDDKHRRSQKASSSKPRRIVHEILLNKNSGKEKFKTEEPGLTRTNLKKFLGAHQRKSGSWSSEIHDPFKKRRVWLGTFGTPEEASKVYAAKKLEFHERKMAQSCMNCTQTSSGCGTDMLCKSCVEIPSSQDSGWTPINLKEFPGVRQRRSGFWVARIHDPFKKCMVRLGTFRTPEKASKVYAAKKLEFRERQDAQSCMDHTRAASDREEGNVPLNVGPNVREILLRNCGNEISNTEESGSVRTNLKAFRGIRQRKSGSLAAEIRDPFKKSRAWLGTWKTPEEASKVYAAKKLELQERQEAQSCMNQTRDVSGSRTDMSSKSGEDGNTGLSFGSIARKKLVNSKKGVEKSDTDKSRWTQSNLKKFQGFRQQKSGCWSVEIHDPYMNHKVNLGTFGTPAEASKVYSAKMLEFRERQDAQSCMNGTRTASVSGTNRSNRNGEEGNAGLNGPILIDHNGFLLGQYSNLDDDLNISE